MGTMAFFGALAVVFLGCGIGWWFDSRERQRGRVRRRIVERETTAIAALREGAVAKIRGVVAAREPLFTSPIGGHACIGYSFMIDDAAHGQDALSWTDRLVSGEVWPSFLVTDATGTVAVQGPLSMFLDPSDGGMNLPPSAYALLEGAEVRMRELLGPRRFAFRETLLKVGDRVSVVGRPSRGQGIDDDGRGSSRAPHPACVMRGSDDEPTVVIDDDEPVGSPVAGAPPVGRPAEAPRVRGPSRREIARRESTAIAALQAGEPVKIRGVVAAREPLLTSPVSGRACVGYRITIHQGPEGYAAENGALVVRREAWPSFLVADDTAMAAVQGPFSILLDPDDGGWTNLPASVYALLEEAKVPLEKEFLFRETLLEPGDRVSVVGRPSLEIDPAGGGSFRVLPRLYVLRGSEEEPVAVVDDDQAVG